MTTPEPNPKPSDSAQAQARGEGRSPERAHGRVALRAWCCVTILVCAGLLASVVAAPSIAPYHIRVRGVYLTLAPLTAGFLLGAICPVWARRHTRPIVAGAALVLLLALLPRLRHDISPDTVYPTLLAGLAVALVFIRLGLLQAGIGWGGRPLDERIFPRGMAVFAYGIAWVWLSAAVINPRETFPPTRWLLTAIGAKPSPAALMPAQVTFEEYALSGRAVAPERARVPAGEYVFSVGPLAARPGEILATISAVRRDGAAFGKPMWLTVDADDPLHPDPMNDQQHFDVSAVDGGTPEGKALRRSASARRFTTYVWFSTTQALPAVRLRARLWMLERETDLGDLFFRPVAEADLGTYDLTVMARLRSQPAR